MDSAEEELKKKLLVLEKSVLDPALNGRGEEIWARMVNVQERGRLLQAEFERAGRNLVSEQGQGIDEEVMKRAKKVSALFRMYGFVKLINDLADPGRLQLAAIPSHHGTRKNSERVRGVGGVETGRE